ncbi:MAG: glycosyltransferase, partial [Ilumatobacteraceae bacterium]
MSTRPCLSVVVPCYNEEATIRTLVGQVLESPWVAQVIVVDDG